MYIVSAFLGYMLIDPIVFDDELTAYKKWACIALEKAWGLACINKKTFDKSMSGLKNLTDVASIRTLIIETLALGYKSLTDTCTLYDYEDVYMVKVSYVENQKRENSWKH